MSRMTSRVRLVDGTEMDVSFENRSPVHHGDTAMVYWAAILAAEAQGHEVRDILFWGTSDRAVAEKKGRWHPRQHIADHLCSPSQKGI